MTTKGQSLFQAANSERGLAGTGTALGALLSFFATAVGNGAVNGPLANFIFVDGSYSGAVTEGSLNAPFTTIADAMAAITQDNTTVYVLPGTYAENVTIPATFNGIVLMGSGRRNTFITGAASGAGVSVGLTATTATPQTFEIHDISISRGANAGIPLNISTTSTTGFQGGVLLQNVDITANGANALPMSLTSLGALTMLNCTVSGTALADPLINTVASAVLRGCTFASLTVSYNADIVGTVPAAGRGPVYLLGGTIVGGALTVTQQPDVVCDPSVRVGSLVGSTLTVGVAVVQAPKIEFHGQQGVPGSGTCNIALPTAAAQASVLILDNATLYDATVDISSAGGTQPISARGVTLAGTTGVIALAGAGACQLDVRGMKGGAAIPYTVAGAGAHTVDRDKIVGLSATVNAAATTFRFGLDAPFAAEPPFPAGVTYAVYGTNEAPAANLDDYLTVTAKSVTQFVTGAMTAAKEIDITIIRTGQLALAVGSTRGPRSLRAGGGPLFWR
jgi:hypothetical protein